MITDYLGYSDNSQEPTLSPAKQEKATAIMTRLDTVDSLLNDMLADSMAEKVGDLALNYQAHKATLLSEGSRLLKQLAAIAGLSVVYNPYQNISPQTHSIKSYW